MSQTRSEIVLYDYNAGISVETTAKKLGLSTGSVYGTRKELGLFSESKPLMLENSFISSLTYLLFFVPFLNPDIDPRQTSIKSGISMLFQCCICHHIWRSSPHQGKRLCKFCINQKRCCRIDCDYCFQYSAASRHFMNVKTYRLFVVLYGRYKKSTNKFVRRLCFVACVLLFDTSIAMFDFTSDHSCRTIARSSSHNTFYICRTCSHRFECSPSRIEGIECSYCSKKLLCSKDHGCKICYDKSFASHPKSVCWDYTDGKNEGKTPHDVFKSGIHVADMICDSCDHSFQAKCNNINTGYWCPYCVGQKRCIDGDCTMCTGRKLSSHAMALFWDYELNPINTTPDDIALGNSKTNYWFKCPSSKHASFPMTPSHIHRGQSCPSCCRKTEAKIGEFLVCAKLSYSKEFKPDWLYNEVTKRHSSFDFFIEEYKTLLELDGLHHFVDGRYQSKRYIPEKMSRSGNSEENRQKDTIKMVKANTNGISGIRIYQPDVFDDVYDWKKWILCALDIVRTSTDPVWVFPSNDCYARHLELCDEKTIRYIILDNNCINVKSVQSGP